MMPDVNFFIIEQHPIDGLNCGIGSLSSVVVNKSITLRSTGFMHKVNLRNVDPAIDDPYASTWCTWCAA